MHRMAGLGLAKSYVMKNVGKVNLCHRRLASFRLKPICTVPKTKDKTKFYPNATNDQTCYGAEGFVLSCK